jgi:HAD superfamily hydrolase (TIGR01509 family)
MDSILHSAGRQRHVASQDWYSEIIASDYQALIFDCDGTLVDSREAHYQSFLTAVSAQGLDVDRSWYESRTGLDRQSLLAAFAMDVCGTLDIALASRESINAFIEGATAVSPILETAELVQKIRHSHPIAVGTNAEFEVATASLRAAKLFDYVEFIASVSDKLAAKPAPDIFLHATQRLGFPSAETVVFEDSNEGVTAAIAAGLDVFQILPN